MHAAKKSVCLFVLVDAKLHPSQLFLAHQIRISAVKFTHVNNSISHTSYQPVGKIKIEQLHVGR